MMGEKWKTGGHIKECKSVFFFLTASVLPACVQIIAGIPVKAQGKEKPQANVYCYNCAKRGHHGYVSPSIYFISLKCSKKTIISSKDKDSLHI